MKTLIYYNFGSNNSIVSKVSSIMYYTIFHALSFET